MRSIATTLCAGALFVVLAAGRSLALPGWASVAPQDTTEALSKRLEDPDEKVRRQAVEDVARANTASGWAMIVDALADDSPLVADEAQVRLGKIADPLGLASLQGKGGLGSKDALVRQRAAEAIGRLEIELDGTALEKLLADRDPKVRRTVLRAIERLAASDRLSEQSLPAVAQRIDQLVKSEKDLDVRAVALPARFAVKPFGLTDLWAMLNNKDEGVVRASVTHLVADIEFEHLVAMYNDSLEYTKFGSTRALVDEFIEHPSASSAKSLTAILGRCNVDRLQWAIVDVLQDWSGKSVGLDVKAWQAWSDFLPAAWEPKSQRKPHPPQAYKTPASLYGLPILSDRLAILVDMTGWTAEKAADGTTGKTLFKNELGRLLRALPENTSFKLVPYASAPVKCGRDWMLEIRLESINQALSCFAECNATGRDNFIEAAQLALAVPGIDTILVVTDSVPAGAQHVHPELVLETLTQANRFHGVFIDALLIHPDAAMEEQWTKVCQPSGGRVLKAEM